MLGNETKPIFRSCDRMPTKSKNVRLLWDSYKLEMETADDFDRLAALEKRHLTVKKAQKNGRPNPGEVDNIRREVAELRDEVKHRKVWNSQNGHGIWGPAFGARHLGKK